MPSFLQGVDPYSLDISIAGLQGIGQAGANPASIMAQNLAAGQQHAARVSDRSAAERAAAQRRRDMELELMRYAGETQELALKRRKEMEQEAGKKKEAGELRALMPDQISQELFDVDQSAGIARAFPAQMTDYQKEQLELSRRSENRLQGKDAREAEAEKREMEKALGSQAMMEEYGAKNVPEEDQDRFWADPKAYIADKYELVQQAQQRTLEHQQATAMALQANPSLRDTPEGMQRAQNMALGYINPSTSPVSGDVMTYNMATSQGTPVTVPEPTLERLRQEGQGGYITVEQMANEIGAYAFSQDVLAKTLGQMDPSVVSEARTKAASQLDMLKNKAIVAFATSSRPPVIEQERISQLFPSKGIFDSAERGKQQLNHLRDMAIQTHDDYISMIESGQLPRDQENELRSKIVELKGLVRGLPTDAMAKKASDIVGGTSAVPLIDRAKKIDPSITMDDINETAQKNGMTPEQVIQELERYEKGGGGG